MNKTKTNKRKNKYSAKEDKTATAATTTKINIKTT